MRPDDAHDRSARLAADREAARQHVDVVAVLVPQPELRLVGRPRRARRSRAPGRRATVVGMDQPLPRADVRLDLVLGVAEHLLPARRVHDGAGLQVPVPDAFLRADERQRQPLFALAQRRFGPLPLGDIEVRADDAHDRAAGLAADRIAAREDVNEVAVLVAQPELALVGVAPPRTTFSCARSRGARRRGAAAVPRR